ncbi:hypothetical protein LUZ61_005210 [Rhynchospora tenuis]|uniref:protein-serine/threonine phosphatase n=1 Tax=Rhynchospora tenuis TaxID=198213 RepID=A0AAD5ZPD3_9POAL|nr:hypothetical protein LUZ61_005210 [Rhynchospora tenuis]
MARDRLRSAVSTVAGDASDGDSSGSLEEISADDFKQSRVWMGYPTVSRNYGQALYSFAWAQAVQNKPLGLDPISNPKQEEEESEFGMGKEEASDEREEGELEEGEIELGLGFDESEEVKKKESGAVEMIDLDSDAPDRESKDSEERELKESDEIGDFDRRVGLILEEIENVTIEEAEKSFEGTCSRLKTSFESLKQLYTEMGAIPVLEAVIQQALVGIKTMITVLDSDGFPRREQNKQFLLRMLIHIKNQYASILSPEQLEELEEDVKSLAFKEDTITKEQKTGTGISITASVVMDTSNRKPIVPKLDLSGTLRSRTVSPILDLHADYDENSLPSPTRDNTTPFPVPKPVGFVPSTITPAQHVIPNKSNIVSANEGVGIKLQPYITDAFKAVSTYQQRYNKNTGFATDDLPSPTPSDEEKRKNDFEAATGEVSSTPISVTSAPLVAPFPGPQPAHVKQGVIKSAPKSRDPRLRIISPETRSSASEPNPNPDFRKNKAAEGSLTDDSVVKRQRIGSGKGGWLEEDNDRAMQPTSSTTNINQQSTIAGPTVSIPTILKDMAVNPTMLVQILQQKLASESQPKTSISNPPPRLPPAPVPAPAIAPVMPTNRPTTKPAEPVPNSNLLAARVIQPPAQPGAPVRMKPRDPRRVLHNTTSTNTSTVTPELVRPNGPPSIDGPTIREQAEPAGTSNASGLKAGPDIAPGGLGSPWRSVDYLLDGYNDEQKAAIQRERARRIAEQNKMFAAKKLCLVLDLDHTLLNSAKFVEVDPVHEEILRQKEEQDREKLQRHLFRFQHMGMWTKLRPGIWNFLEKASKLFEMHLYTMGNKLYATEMAKVLDPKGSLFAGRVISRGDDGDSVDGDDRVPKSKDLEGVLGMESAVVIIDDSVRVWPHNKHNLIVVERYTYFPCSRRQFGLPGPSLLELDLDERPEDGTLASSLAVIERIHANFFMHRSLNDADVRNILAAEQKKVLGGCKIVFSRVFPVGEQNPHMHPLWQMAEQFGAICTNHLDDGVTHVVANSLGTDKVNWALSRGRFVVHPSWLEASTLLYRRANEVDFAVVKL